MIFIKKVSISLCSLKIISFLIFFFKANLIYCAPPETSSCSILFENIEFKKLSLLEKTYYSKQDYIAIYYKLNNKKYLVLGQNHGIHYRLNKSLQEHIKSSNLNSKEGIIFAGEVRLEDGKIIELRPTSSILREKSSPEIFIKDLRDLDPKLLSNKFYEDSIFPEVTYKPEEKHLNKEMELYSFVRHDLQNTMQALIGFHNLAIQKTTKKDKTIEFAKKIGQNQAKLILDKITQFDSLVKKNNPDLGRNLSESEMEFIRSYLHIISNLEKITDKLTPGEYSSVREYLLFIHNDVMKTIIDYINMYFTKSDLEIEIIELKNKL